MISCLLFDEFLILHFVILKPSILA